MVENEIRRQLVIAVENEIEDYLHRGIEHLNVSTHLKNSAKLIGSEMRNSIEKNSVAEIDSSSYSKQNQSRAGSLKISDRKSNSKKVSDNSSFENLPNSSKNNMDDFSKSAIYSRSIYI